MSVQIGHGFNFPNSLGDVEPLSSQRTKMGLGHWGMLLVPSHCFNSKIIWLPLACFSGSNLITKSGESSQHGLIHSSMGKPN